MPVDLLLRTCVSFSSKSIKNRGPVQKALHETQKCSLWNSSEFFGFYNRAIYSICWRWPETPFFSIKAKLIFCRWSGAQADLKWFFTRMLMSWCAIQYPFPVSLTFEPISFAWAGRQVFRTWPFEILGQKKINTKEWERNRHLWGE